MAIPTYPEGVVAVTFVVDASLKLAAQWPKFVVECAGPLLKRLGDANPGYKVQ
jgi:hypothetical protein